ncbi:MAG TPA: hypothetical protein PK640_14290 [Verrucomicrobiota bacterium]|nr:hypothetical protein [Verrucomicrobiota bacterium]
MTAIKRLTRVTPLRAGIVSGILYGIAGLIAVPFLLMAAIFGRDAGGALAFAILAPVFYAVAGFIGGLIAAALYNLVAKWTGGLEFEVSDDATGVETA